VRSLRKYHEMLLISTQTILAYPLEVISRAGVMAVLIFVFIQLWTVTFRLSGQTTISGFDLPRMIWYLVLTESVVMSCPRTFDKIDLEVKSGDLAYRLARPYSYAFFHGASYLGHVVLALPANFAVGAALALVLAGPPHLAPAAWPVVLLAVLLAICLNFVVELTIGLLAFWFEDTYAFFWIYQKLTFTLGGLFLPLALFPATLRAVASRLPFSAITYAPARLSAGFDVRLAVGTFATQLGWLAVLGCLAALVYRRGVRRVNINGG
jgi:ABC-2 type transport system permease protein